MNSFDNFAQHLHEALTHLYDPIYQPPALFAEILGLAPQPGAEAIQQTIKQMIAQFAPTSDTPIIARSRRLYDLLNYRYVHELTQEETAHRLGITPRHLRREQQQAILALAQRLWQARQNAKPTAIAIDSLQTGAGNKPLPLSNSNDWHRQIRQELAHLQQNAPGAVTDVATGLTGLLRLGEQLTTRHGVGLQFEPITQPLLAAIHPAAFRQIVLSALEQLSQSMMTGQIVLRADRNGTQAQIEVTGNLDDNVKARPGDLLQEIVSAQHGQVSVHAVAGLVTFQIRLPLATQRTVLVIDDNDDLVHFYRRYTAQTCYEIVHLAQGQPLLATVKALAPAMIVLDVMLPDVDGWELLTVLHEDPDTRTIPVIICSIVNHAELALALGATHTLVKPVGRLEFVQALDQVYQSRIALARIDQSTGL